MTTLDIANDFPMIDGTPVCPIFGAEVAGGYHTASDVLVDKTADGISLESIWDTLRVHVLANKRMPTIATNVDE